MATVTKKDKFFEVLRNIFVGAKIEGNSGYVNLMKIKSKYYNEFKEQLHIDIDAKLKEVGQNFEEELYNKLFTFFKKYFSENYWITFANDTNKFSYYGLTRRRPKGKPSRKKCHTSAFSPSPHCPADSGLSFCIDSRSLYILCFSRI